MHVAPGSRISNAWSTVKQGSERVWGWLASPWTLDAAYAARMVDQGPVGQQLRNLGERTQAHGTTIEVISAQVSDLVRDHELIRTMLDRHTDVFERMEATLARLAEQSQTQTRTNTETLQFATEVRNRLFESRSVAEDIASVRSELADGVRRVQQTLAEETASLRSRLSSLVSSEQIQNLMGQAPLAQELASARAQLSGEIESIRERMATMPSQEHVQTLIGGGMVVDELATVRREFAEEIDTVRRALARDVAGLHERLATLPSAEQIQALVGETLLQEITSAKKQLESEITTVHEALAAETTNVHALLASLPSTDQVHTLVGGTVVNELAPVRALLEGLPSAEQLQTLVNSGPLVQELSTTRVQVADGLQKLHQALAEHAAGVRERVAALPSTEQVHAFVEGGTAANIQSARRFISEEAQRGQANAERMTRKLEFLQARSVIPLVTQGLVMCRNPLGFVAVPADDLATIGALADGVLPKQGTLKVVEKFLKPGGTFVDVGANVGMFSLMAARIVGPAGKVVAIEPAPAVAEALRATVRANGLSHVVSVKEIAAGAEHGLGTLSVGTNGGHSSLLPSDSADNTVVASIAPLDEVLDGMQPDMIKIDVEGWEANVIEGMKGVLRANPDVIVIMDFEPQHIRRTGLSAASWVDRALGAGLQIFEIDERNGELTPLRRQGIEEIQSINVVIARNDPSRRDASPATDTWLRLGPTAAA